MAIATFAAGCFWGVEAAFQKVPGVVATRVGYTGGETAEPTYHDVCSDTTGHAEAVQIDYDPDLVSYHHLLEIFFSLHNPTELDRQGPDIGSQYRSVIFFHSEEQQKIATAFINAQTSSGRFENPIATRIEPATTFWPAEDHHQSYYLKMGRRYGGL